MGAALTPREIVAALDHWRVPYAEVPGWEKRDNGTQWGDVTGCMFHHTAGDGTDAREREIITFGHSSLPGPLAQFGPRDDGILDVIAAGPANHAGGGDPDVLAAVRAESYGDYPPKTTKHHGSAGSIIGNRMFYGWETYYAGPGDPTVNPKQYRVAILSMAAITWALDREDGDGTTWTSKSTIGHKEWSDWKPDPAGVDMKDARADIQWCLDNGPDAARNWYDTGERDDMPTPDEIADAVWRRVLADPRKADGSGTTAERWVVYGNIKSGNAVAAIEGAVAVLSAAMAEAIAQAQSAKGESLTGEEIAAVAEATAARVVAELGDDFEAVGDVKLVPKKTEVQS